ncbi:E3 ubiquitin-protein ligase TRIM56-like [Hydractinia symbiolongicarpus]|uniref:E3 ubiquitin-protein ligase TRIM56-like n=1 Tax=Hydractinia symbiolongicarpus TaxID=13093 RepID=UPI00254A3D64|nr:E3 ubiquitin-protein ligase TRIM56-like [Hydractinia symbiolongicarpus]
MSSGKITMNGIKAQVRKITMLGIKAQNNFLGTTIRKTTLKLVCYSTTACYQTVYLSVTTCYQTLKAARGCKVKKILFYPQLSMRVPYLTETSCLSTQSMLMFSIRRRKTYDDVKSQRELIEYILSSIYFDLTQELLLSKELAMFDLNAFFYYTNVSFLCLTFLENTLITIALSATQISSILECKICLDTYHQPNQLYFAHLYCEHCLDDLATFNEDGGAEIRCPLRYSMKTKLDPRKTTLTLNTAYIVNDILRPNIEKVNSQCQQSKECKRILSSSCATCGANICNRCQNIHSCTNQSFSNVSFNEKLQEMQPLCEEHNSSGRFVCIHCDNTFTCVYCIHRSYKNHERKSVAEVGEEARKWFQSFIASFDETKVILENLTKQYDESLNNLNSSREAFVCELKVRKLKKNRRLFENDKHG